MRTQLVILNGQFVTREEAMVDIEDRGYQFGDGIYEVIRVYNGKLFTFDEHMRRLYDSARKLDIDISYQTAQLKQMLTDLVVRNKLQLGIVYVQFSRGVSARGHAFPIKETVPSFVAYTKEMNQPLVEIEQGVCSITTEDIRWLRCDIKSLNLLGNILAKQKAKEAGCYEAVQHRGEIVTEGSSSNVSIVKDGKIITHPANNFILNGITRQKVLQLCQENRIACIEKTFTLDELFAADEIFLTGTTTEVMPIIEMDGKQIGDGKPGEITKQLQQLFQQEIKRQCFH